MDHSGIGRDWVICKCFVDCRIDSLHDDSKIPAFHGIRIIYRTELLGGNLRSELVGTTDLAAWIDYDDLGTLPLVGVAKYGVKLAYGEYKSAI